MMGHGRRVRPAQIAAGPAAGAEDSRSTMSAAHCDMLTFCFSRAGHVKGEPSTPLRRTPPGPPLPPPPLHGLHHLPRAVVLPVAHVRDDARTRPIVAVPLAPSWPPKSNSLLGPQSSRSAPLPCPRRTSPRRATSSALRRRPLKRPHGPLQPAGGVGAADVAPWHPHAPCYAAMALLEHARYCA